MKLVTNTILVGVFSVSGLLLTAVPANAATIDYNHCITDSGGGVTVTKCYKKHNWFERHILIKQDGYVPVSVDLG